MLVLTRKPGETLRIGEAVSITVLELDGNRVRLGTRAPGSVLVYREEIYRLIKKKAERNKME